MARARIAWANCSWKSANNCVPNNRTTVRLNQAPSDADVPVSLILQVTAADHELWSGARGFRAGTPERQQAEVECKVPIKAYLLRFYLAAKAPRVQPFRRKWAIGVDKNELGN